MYDDLFVFCVLAQGICGTKFLNACYQGDCFHRKIFLLLFFVTLLCCVRALPLSLRCSSWIFSLGYHYTLDKLTHKGNGVGMTISFSLNTFRLEFQLILYFSTETKFTTVSVTQMEECQQSMREVLESMSGASNNFFSLLLAYIFII